MLFTSYEFFGFVVVLFLAYYLLPKQCQWPLLLAASYLFYAAAGPQFLPYLLATTAATYLAGRGIGRNLARQSAYLKEHKAELSKEEKKAYKDRQKRIRLRWVAFCLLVDLGILVVVKYTGFLLSNVSGALSLLGWTGELSFVSLALPLGISFYTFQAVGYLIDVYRGTVPAEENPFKLALFLSFFPQLIQGPISRFGDLSKTLYGPHPFDRHTLALGLQRVLWGYFKKMVLADRVITAVTTLIGEPGPMPVPGYRWGCSSTPSSSTPISPAASTSPSAWPRPWASMWRRTSTGPISPSPSRSTGAGGTSPCAAGSGTTSSIPCR